ncbi:hypothetical protein [Elizabethkingia anophelis]|nr:hypothetical protein [Elizabethkingia anophelis]EJC8058738.1 hypothetical protein [Elizabethkingia anophelis]MCL1640491.1 hypothetical protein [Elizabethkingia anophelis]MCL1645091.1 hypothetical protein [Elizabethkingia anophelis]MCL1689730.1 hypothetical protein [Elizabethkingia anophelis]MCT3787078.1 hypothetical protein [Elizabethkingia anophelis]
MKKLLFLPLILFSMYLTAQTTDGDYEQGYIRGYSSVTGKTPTKVPTNPNWQQKSTDQVWQSGTDQTRQIAFKSNNGYSQVWGEGYKRGQQDANIALRDAITLKESERKIKKEEKK